MEALSSSPHNRSFLSFIPRRGRSTSIPPPLPTNTHTAAGELAASPPTTSTLGNMLRRNRRDSNAPGSPVQPDQSSRPAQTTPTSSPAAPGTTTSTRPVPSDPPVLHRIRLVPHLESQRSLPFEPIIRDAIEYGPVLRVGRFTDRQHGASSAANSPTATKIAFRSKVVSRGHAEVWCEANGQFFLKDTKSSSGTFLNHIRLAPANTESPPFPIKDGDIIQLGIDYQGGQQEIYRCVKIRVEIGREWQTTANAFNASALQRLGSLGVTSVAPSAVLAGPNAARGPITRSLTDPNPAAKPTVQPSSAASSNTTDCCICLFPVTVCQALFIAPCSHAFHYKCMRPLLIAHHPGFSCPLCRTFADLESDVEVELPEHYMSKASPLAQDAIPEEPAVDHGSSDRRGDNASVEGEDEVEAMITSDVEHVSADGSASRSVSSASGVPIEEDAVDADTSAEFGLLGGTAATPMNTTFLSILADAQVPSSSTRPLAAPSASGSGHASELDTLSNSNRARQKAREDAIVIDSSDSDADPASGPAQEADDMDDVVDEDEEDEDVLEGMDDVDVDDEEEVDGDEDEDVVGGSRRRTRTASARARAQQMARSVGAKRKRLAVRA